MGNADAYVQKCLCYIFSIYFPIPIWIKCGKTDFELPFKRPKSFIQL